MEGGEREVAMSAPREVPIRDSAPPQSSRTLESSHARSWSSSIPVPDVSRPTSSDVWSGAINRLQTQVSLNTSMLESHRRQLQEVDTQVRSLTQDLGNVINGLQELRAELRARPSGAGSARHDAGDLDVLVGQVEAVTNKANEVDGLKLQLDLMKNRMKRLEEQSPTTGHHARPSTSSTHRESSVHDAPPPHHLPHGPHHHHHPSHHHQLPPMRTASSMASPVENRPTGYQPPHGPPPVPILESQGRPPYRPPEMRKPSSESPATMQASSSGSFRPPEPLPPPSALPGWRSSESQHHPSGFPLPSAAGPVRPPTIEPEPQATGWASVNANQPIKRPFEEPRRSPYESPGSGSPKRPKLAPIMPRSSYGEESYVPSSMTPSGQTETSSQSRSRALSDASQSQPPNLGTQASTNAPSYRFITSTQQADSQESWRPEHERKLHGHHHHPHHHGRNRGGRRGGRGGRRGRGGGVQLPEPQEFGTPEWEKSNWTGSQISPNGYYHPMNPHSRKEGCRPTESGGAPEGEYEAPETPTQNPDDPTTAGNEDGQPTSAGKKTRTRPIRNAEGVLIRKDGRPDMRSVSSANNLRKVHAKKEAERAEMEGRTPTSARSLAPANPYSDDENAAHSDTPGTPAEQDEGEETDHGPQETQQDLMSKILPQGVDDGRNTAERYFPRTNQQDVPDAVMKIEGEERQNGQGEQRNGGSQMSDVVMREMSDAQAEDHRERDPDTRMATVDEMEEEQEVGNERREQELQSSEQTAN